MITLRKSAERGHANHGWLDSYHSFSFANYYDKNFMGFRSLRVINEDRIAGGGGFPSHPHRDMEIITYMIEGRLEHQDSMGNKAIIKPGEVQRMSAGTGVVHSEANASKDELAHLLQIWIMTNKNGHQPGYGQKDFSQEIKNKSLVLTASLSGRDGSIEIHQDVNLYLGRVKTGDTTSYEFKSNRYGWIQMIKGELHINQQKLLPGDGAAISDEKLIELKAINESEFLLFDLN